MTQKTCFVVMGYGRKVDYVTGRTLDLDKTYRGIIKPAVEACNLKCIRANEIKHSSVIDVVMYEHLLNADVVIADLSTLNPNAIYELGVRHGLKPMTTIVISESKLKYPFDLEHVVIRPYDHMGDGIDFEEVERFKAELQESITDILNEPRIDSPVYVYLSQLRPPHIPTDIEARITESMRAKESLGAILDEAESALSKSDFQNAISLFQKAKAIDPYESYITQRLALVTYKSKLPDPISALNAGLELLQELEPEETTDPETLGLCSAIQKRLYEISNDKMNLEKAIHHSERGYQIRRSYYNGINLAFLYLVRASIATNESEAIADTVNASRIYQDIIRICKQLIADDSYEQRDDKYWLLATLAEAYFGLNDIEEFTQTMEQACTETDTTWMLDTTQEQIEKIKALKAMLSKADTTSEHL